MIRVRASAPMCRRMSGLRSRTQRHWKASLRRERIRGRFDIGEQLAVGLLAGDAARYALDRRAMHVPWVCVEPNPSGGDLHMADHAFLVVRVRGA